MVMIARRRIAELKINKFLNLIISLLPVILTLFITKDKLDKKNYESVITQERDQKVIVVSATPINIENNFVFKPDQNLTHSERIALSINAALKRFSLEEFDYLFKVDGDAFLPEGYLKGLIITKKPIAGVGMGLLIEVKTFLKYLKKWPVVYADDSYIFFYGYAKGLIDSFYPSVSLAPYRLKNRKRELMGGREIYRYGVPIGYYLLECIRSMNFWSFIGYLMSIRSNRYEWSQAFTNKISIQKYFEEIKVSRVRTQLFN
jgi:hypothetical protein